MNPRPPQMKSRGRQYGLPTADVPERLYRRGGQTSIKKLKKPVKKHRLLYIIVCLRADICSP